MKKILCVIMVTLLALSASGCAGESNAAGDSQEARAAVTTLVAQFGAKLQMVSLLAPEDLLAESMEENYTEFVTPELMGKWLASPSSALGRTVSSPWPDRIEVTSVEAVSKDVYLVRGDVIEITGVEKEQGGVAARRPVVLTVTKTEPGWHLSDVTIGDYAGSVVYKNKEYGFSVVLPESWKGYSIVTEAWEGLAIGEDGAVDEDPAETGSIILVRHPRWTDEKVRQDIPIMVFTLAQWESMEKDEFHIGAAPMNPTELARSAGHVFALPARYNYAFPEGFEEVEDILAGDPIRIP